MPPDSPAHDSPLTDRDLAALIEGSESRAYGSLMTAAPRPFLAEQGIIVRRFDSAVALLAASVPGSLNVNRVIGLGIHEAIGEHVLDRIDAFYRSHGSSYAIELSPAAGPAGIAGLLRARGMRRAVASTLLYRHASPVHPHAGEPGIDVVHAIREQSDLVAEICCRVFRMPAAVHALIHGTAGVPGWRQWLAFSAGVPVGAALSFLAQDVAWLGWDATLPEFRGRGVQGALIAHRLREALASGCRFATAETGVDTAVRKEPSLHNYRRAGFRCAYQRPTYVALRRSAEGVAQSRQQQAAGDR